MVGFLNLFLLSTQNPQWWTSSLFIYFTLKLEKLYQLPSFQGSSLKGDTFVFQSLFLHPVRSRKRKHGGLNWHALQSLSQNVSLSISSGRTYNYFHILRLVLSALGFLNALSQQWQGVREEGKNTFGDCHLQSVLWN